MTLTNFISELQAMRIAITAEDGNLRLRGRTEKLTPAEIDWLRRHKPAILRMLEHHAENPPERLRLFIGRKSGAKAYSRWPLDSKNWQPELN